MDKNFFMIRLLSEINEFMVHETHTLQIKYGIAAYISGKGKRCRLFYGQEQHTKSPAQVNILHNIGIIFFLLCTLSYMIFFIL